MRARMRAGVDPDQASDEGYRTEGNAPVYAMLRDASARAKQAGARDVEEKAVEGSPVDALLKLADSAGADLIVVGSVGFNSVVGRLIGLFDALFVTGPRPKCWLSTRSSDLHVAIGCRQSCEESNSCRRNAYRSAVARQSA